LHPIHHCIPAKTRHSSPQKPVFSAIKIQRWQINRFMAREQFHGDEKLPANTTVNTDSVEFTPTSPVMHAGMGYLLGKG